MNLGQFRTAVANELGLDVTNEVQTIDDALNNAVQRVLEDTHCYVKLTNYTAFDGTSLDYTLDSTILEVVDMSITSSGTQYDLDRLSVPALISARRAASPAGTPTSYFAVTGDNLIMFYPAPGATDTLAVYNVPVPTAMSATANDPSTTTYGGVPQQLHRAIFYRACGDLASYDDDQTSAQGQRYLDWYDKEIVRHMKRIRKKGGVRNARAVVNDGRRRRIFGREDVYPRI